MILKLVLLILLLVGGCVWFRDFWRRRFAFEPGYEEIHLVGTRDGWRIALYRYPPPVRKHEIPVLLCHGLGANRHNFDLGPETSLAVFLREAGFDVWSIDLRGRDGGGRGVWAGMPSRTDHSFDDYVREDAPAAIRHVLGRTGASHVHWIGHSMGGLILYALLETEEAGAIASGVAIGSPGAAGHMGGSVRLGNIAVRMLRRFPGFQFSCLAAALSPLLVRIGIPGEKGFMNRNNVEPLVLERALCHLVANMSAGELSQFLDWMKTGDLRSRDGTYSYAENFGSIRRPLLLMAGSRDYLVPPESVAAVYDRISSSKKDFVVLGRQQGQQEEYGHGDLLIGKNVRSEVFPRIAEWLVSCESTEA